MNNKPFSQACERNKYPILEFLRDFLIRPGLVLEIGSGTGQHGVFFAEKLPHITWQFSDMGINIAGIEKWYQECNLSNTLPPIVLNVADKPWPIDQVDYIYSANTLHIMEWHEVEEFLEGVQNILKKDGLLFIYGPFNYNGLFTSESNASFDQSLRERNPEMGLRDFVAINVLLEKNGLKLRHDYAMPANNRLLIWQRIDDH